MKLNPSGAVVDYFTPHNQAALDAANFDLGSSGVMLLPDQSGAHPHLAIHAGKNETINLIDRDNMGHFSPNNDNQIVQSLVNIFPNGTPEPGNYNAPAYFNGTVYFAPVNDTLMAFRLNNGLLPVIPTSKTSEVYTYPGGAIAVSANGERQRNSLGGAAERLGGCGRAFAPTTPATLPCNSTTATRRARAIRWTSPRNSAFRLSPTGRFSSDR